MNRKERRASRNHYNKKEVMDNRTKRDTENLNKIKSTLNKKIKRRLEELNNLPEYKDSPIKHVQVNYFNISKLGFKYQANKPKPVGMSYGDAVVRNTQLGPNQPPSYLCVNIYFDEEQLTGAIYQVLLGLTSKVHNWEYSKEDDLYIDQLGVYVDRVDIEKEVDSNGNENVG